MSRRWLLWLLAPLPLMLPFFCFPRVELLGNSDALFYGNILAMTSDALMSGDLFARWFADANAGFGSPVMLFYAPLAYLLGGLTNLPFLPLHLDSGDLLMTAIYASQIASGFTAYLWLKRSFSEKTALIGSLLFVLLPYKLVYIYLHHNLAQLWALAFLPLWMIAAELMAARDNRSIGLYALMLAAVYYCHPLTLIAFAAVPAVYALWFGRTALGHTVLRLALAHLLAAGLCAMHALPGHLAIGYIHAERFFADKYSWQNNFFHIDVVFCAYYGIIALLVGLGIARVPSVKASPAARVSWLWITVLCAFFFMTQRVSMFIWEALPPLQYLQFPAARLHAVALLAVVYLTCLWLEHGKAMSLVAPLLYRTTTLAACIIAFGLITALNLYKTKNDPANFNVDYLGLAQEARLISTPVAVYETQWGCIDAKTAFQIDQRHEVPPQVAVTAGQGKITDVSWQPGAIAFNLHADSLQTELRVRQCYFPLWHATDENAKDIPLFDDPAAWGLTKMILPQGTHHVAMTFALTPLDKVLRIVAALSLVLALGLACRRKATT